MKRAAAIALLPLGAALAGAARAEQGSTITITATDLRNAKGMVLACLTSEEASFPKCRDVLGVRGAKAKAHEGSVTLTFKDVPEGRYAIAILHDENGNGKADRMLGMMPKEGFGFSRDAKVRMGPPKFSEAAFDLGNSDKAMAIKVRYML